MYPLKDSITIHTHVLDELNAHSDLSVKYDSATDAQVLVGEWKK